MILVSVSRTVDTLHQLILETLARAKGLIIGLLRGEVEGERGRKVGDLIGARLFSLSCVAPGMLLLQIQSLGQTFAVAGYFFPT